VRKPGLIAALCAVTCTLILGGVPPASAATTSYCGITWGSLPKTLFQHSAGPIVDARVGRQECFDRFVIDLASVPAAGYNVRYTDGFSADPYEDRLPVAGGAILTVSALAPAHDEHYNPTVPWRVGDHIVGPTQFSAGGFRTFRDLVYGGSFEATTRFGLGVRARLPFRVFQLAGPGTGSRLVVDVAHQW
jgi:hypothetical protein